MPDEAASVGQRSRFQWLMKPLSFFCPLQTLHSRFHFRFQLAYRPDIRKGRIDLPFLIKHMETDEILLIVAQTEGCGAEDGFQTFVQFEVLVIDEFVHFGVVLPKQGLERLVPQDYALAVVLVTDTKGGTVLRQEHVIDEELHLPDTIGHDDSLRHLPFH